MRSTNWKPDHTETIVKTSVGVLVLSPGSDVIRYRDVMSAETEHHSRMLRQMVMLAKVNCRRGTLVRILIVRRVVSGFDVFSCLASPSLLSEPVILTAARPVTWRAQRREARSLKNEKKAKTSDDHGGKSERIAGSLRRCKWCRRVRVDREIATQ